jgi:hypothetical protein
MPYKTCINNDFSYHFCTAVNLSHIGISIWKKKCFVRNRWRPNVQPWNAKRRPASLFSCHIYSVMADFNFSSIYHWIVFKYYANYVRHIFWNYSYSIVLKFLSLIERLKYRWTKQSFWQYFWLGFTNVISFWKWHCGNRSVVNTRNICLYKFSFKLQNENLLCPLKYIKTLRIM